MFLPLEELCQQVAAALVSKTETVTTEMVKEEIEYLAEHRRLVLEQLEEITAVYLTALYQAECYVAARLLELADSRSLLQAVEPAALAADGLIGSGPAEAVQQAVEAGLLVITADWVPVRQLPFVP